MIFAVAEAQVMLHRAAPDGRVDSVRMAIDLPHEFTGKDVIIGVTDWGFDYTHPVFYDTGMVNYRVLRAWDQFKESGPAPAGFTYGTEYVGRDALLEARCDTSNVYEYAYHGTHCAGIAGGGGAGTQYRGVAVDAEFLFVSVNLTDQQVIDAWRWMYDVAQQEGKRLVVSMSWGLYYLDNMDGTGPLADEMRRLSDLGVVFVSSAGNNGDVDFHMRHTFTQKDTVRTQFTFPHSSIGSDITMMGSENSSFSFSLLALDNSFETVARTQYFSTMSDTDADTFMVAGIDTVRFSYHIESSNQYNNRPSVQLTVFYNANLRFGLEVAAEDCDLHAWNLARIKTNYGNWGGTFQRPASKPDWIAGDRMYGVSTPANVDCSITVAAHSSRYKSPSGNMAGGSIASFSSWGPSFHSVPKPDISAPGVNVVSSLSSYTNTYDGTYTKSVVFNGRTYRFVSLSGTSMAAPFVAGVAALVLQANPYLSSAQVKEILLQTAYHDSFTDEYGSNRFGSGKVNAYQAVLKALGTVGVEQYFATSTSSYTVYPNPIDDLCYVTANTDCRNILCEVFDITGRKVLQSSFTQGVNSLSLGGLKPGCYVMKLINDRSVDVKKIVVR